MINKDIIEQSQRCQRNWDLTKSIKDEDMDLFKTAVSQCPSKQQRIWYNVVFIKNRKIIEDIYNCTAFFDYPFEEVKHEVVSFLVMQMPKYKADKGRAFSYFSVIGKNYLILNNNNNYKKMKTHDEVKVLDFKRNVLSESIQEQADEFNIQFVDQMLEYWDNNITNIFRRQKDILVADAVLELFRRRKNIENFNKKALYIMIREMTGSNTQHITRVINQMKRYYFNMMEEFSAVGEIDTSNTGSIF